MNELLPPFKAVGLTTIILLPATPDEWPIEGGDAGAVVHLVQFRRGEIEIVAEQVKQKIIRDWEIAHESPAAKSERARIMKQLAINQRVDANKIAAGDGMVSHYEQAAE